MSISCIQCILRSMHWDPLHLPNREFNHHKRGPGNTALKGWCDAAHPILNPHPDMKSSAFRAIWGVPHILHCAQCSSNHQSIISA